MKKSRIVSILLLICFLLSWSMEPLAWAEHKHVAAKCGPNYRKWYEPNSSETHIVYEYEGDQLCGCGAFVEEGITTSRTESHTFSKYSCTKCGYQKEHTHVAGACAPNSKVTYGQNNSETHYRYEYEGDYICGCGAYVEDGNTYTYVEEHSFDGDYCVVCGYQKEHVHVASKCAPNSSVWYDSKDNDTHIKYVYEGDYLCGCGAYVCEGVTNSYTEKHDFSNGICNDCKR